MQYWGGSMHHCPTPAPGCEMCSEFAGCPDLYVPIACNGTVVAQCQSLLGSNANTLYALPSHRLRLGMQEKLSSSHFLFARKTEVKTDDRQAPGTETLISAFVQKAA